MTNQIGLRQKWTAASLKQPQNFIAVHENNPLHMQQFCIMLGTAKGSVVTFKYKSEYLLGHQSYQNQTLYVQIEAVKKLSTNKVIIVSNLSFIPHLKRSELLL